VLRAACAAWQGDGGDHQHDERVTSVSIEAEGRLHPEAINVWLQDLMMERGTDIFRSKGVLSLAGTDDKCAVL
jgi:G3E family GTPase